MTIAGIIRRTICIGRQPRSLMSLNSKPGANLRGGVLLTWTVMPANGRQSASSLLRVRSAPSVHRFRLLRYGPDRGELIGGQRLLGKQQAAALIEVGAPCAQDGSRLLEGLRDYVAHRHVDLALGRLGGFDAAGRSPQERLRTI